MSTWKTLDEFTQNERDLKRGILVDTFEREVMALLRPLVNETETINLPAIESYMPTYNAAINAAEKSPFADDMEIANLVGNMRQTTSNPAALRYALQQFHRLTPETILKNGQVDRNKPAIIASEIKDILSCGRNCRAGMQRSVQRLESRLNYLISTRSDGSPTPTPAEPPPAAIATPEKSANAVIETRTEFDPRARR